MIRFFDTLFSIIGLVLLSPLFTVLYFLIRIESQGGGFYSQERIGKNGKPFKLFKFRSMRIGSDKKGLITIGEKDNRITKTGFILRKYKLDELPQLWNVFIGDMSLVGPRPPLPSEVAEYSDYDKQRLYVTPGCTGLWQATERNEVGFNEMVQLDIQYIQRASFMFDLWIIWKTVEIIIKPNGSY